MNVLQVAVCAILVAVAAGAALTENDVPILYQSMSGPNEDGGYSYRYETGNGINVEEQGEQRRSELPDPENEYELSVQGSFKYPGSDGKEISVSYVADENGFQPSGEHLPTSPPIPTAILRALEWIAAHPPQEKKQK